MLKDEHSTERGRLLGSPERSVDAGREAVLAAFGARGPRAGDLVIVFATPGPGS